MSDPYPTLRKVAKHLDYYAAMNAELSLTYDTDGYDGDPEEVPDSATVAVEDIEAGITSKHGRLYLKRGMDQIFVTENPWLSRPNAYALAVEEAEVTTHV